MSSGQIRIGLVDDHKAFRQALKVALCENGDMTVIFEVGNGNELMMLLPHSPPDVLLLDIKMPVMNGLQTLEVLSNQYPEVRVLLLTAYLDEAYVSKCLEYNINGYLTKNMDLADIKDAIETANLNEVYITNLLTEQYFKKYISNFKKHIPTDLSLSLEEIRIVEFLQQEKSIEEIAALMYKSKRSIEMKREKIKSKLHTSTTAGILLNCLKRGIIE